MLNITPGLRKITSKTYKNTLRYENMKANKQNSVNRNKSSVFCFVNKHSPVEPQPDTDNPIEPMISRQKNTFIKRFLFWNKSKHSNNLTNLLALSQFQLNDQVNIDHDFDTVQSLQVGHGGWCEPMFEVKPKTKSQSHCLSNIII